MKITTESKRAAKWMRVDEVPFGSAFRTTYFDNPDSGDTYLRICTLNDATLAIDLRTGLPAFSTEVTAGYRAFLLDAEVVVRGDLP